MDLLDIRIYPDEMLRQECAPLETVTLSEKDILEKMLFAMHHYGGIGLAAPQVGILKRLIVADIGEGPLKLANPQIVWVKGKDTMAEGCLSVPKIQVEIDRSTEIIVTGLDEKGKKTEWGIKGLLARVIQHEIDHLDGKLILDYQDRSEGGPSSQTARIRQQNADQNTF